MHRNHSKKITIGSREIGGGSPILIQSMTNTKTEDVASTIAQIKRLEAAGCDIVRVAVPSCEAAKALARIKEATSLPLVADIHFDHRLAVAAIQNGADKIRINPGNIGGEMALTEVVNKAKARGIPIRVGVNGGSLEKTLLEKYRGVSAEALVESALGQVRQIETRGYDNLVVSIKSSDVLMSLAAHEQIAARCGYPLHVGITEAGSVASGSIKSAVGLSLILQQGIGDTIRVSLTGDPVEEVRVARQILRNLGLISAGIEVISCPTCGRTEVDLLTLAGQVEEMARELEESPNFWHGIRKPSGGDHEQEQDKDQDQDQDKDQDHDQDHDQGLVENHPPSLKIAVMGCAVNGPGEAREADIGIACGKGEGLLFKKGEIIKKLPESELLVALRAEITHLTMDNI